MTQKILIIIFLGIGWASFAHSVSASVNCGQKYSRTISVGSGKLVCRACINTNKFQITRRRVLGQYNIDRSLPSIEFYPISLANSDWRIDDVQQMLDLSNKYLRAQKCGVQLRAQEVVEIRAPVGYEVLEELEQIEIEKSFGFLPMVVLADDLLRKSKYSANSSKDEELFAEGEEELSELDFNFSEDTNGLGIIGRGYIYLSNNLLVEKQRTTCLPLLLLHEIFHAMLGYESEQHSRDYYNVFYANCLANIHTLQNTKISPQDCKNLRHYANSIATGQRNICAIK